MTNTQKQLAAAAFATTEFTARVWKLNAERNAA